jgi:hypothetical protein
MEFYFPHYLFLTCNASHSFYESDTRAPHKRDFVGRIGLSAIALTLVGGFFGPLKFHWFLVRFIFFVPPVLADQRRLT